MSKKCEKCKKLSNDNYSYCQYCGNPLKKVKKNNFKTALIIIAIMILIIVGIKLGKMIEEMNRPKTYLRKYVIPSIKEIYKGYTINGEFVTKKTCTESYSTCAGDSGSGSKDVDIYYYRIEIKDDRYPGDVISSVAYYNDDDNTVYNADLVMSLSAHNIEQYLRTVNNYKNAKVVVKKFTGDEDADSTDICNYDVRNYYNVYMYLDIPYNHSSNIYTMANIANAIDNIEKEIIECRWGYENSGKKIYTACASNIKYNIIFNDGYRLEKDGGNQKLISNDGQEEDND